MCQRELVGAARERQQARLGDAEASCNAQLTPRLLREHVRLDTRGEAILQDAYDRGTLSARGRERVLRVARTIADLEASDGVSDSHLSAALALRHDDPIAAVGAA